MDRGYSPWGQKESETAELLTLSLGNQGELKQRGILAKSESCESTLSTPGLYIACLFSQVPKILLGLISQDCRLHS